MEFRQGVWIDEQIDASSDARLSADQPLAFEGQHHLMHGRWGDGEEALHVSFGGWPTHDERVGVNEGQVLALLFCEAWIWGRGVHVT